MPIFCYFLRSILCRLRLLFKSQYDATWLLRPGIGTHIPTYLTVGPWELVKLLIYRNQPQARRDQG